MKAKADGRFGDPVEMVGPEKQRRIRRAAEAWLVANAAHRGLIISFEALAVRPGKLERVPFS